MKAKFQNFTIHLFICFGRMLWNCN